MSSLLAGRRAVVTGGSRGIGLAIARELVAQGSAVAICGRAAESVEHAVAELRTLGPGRAVYGLAADVTDPRSLQRFALGAMAALGGIDSLVCNAGIWGPMGPFESLDWDEWLYAFDVNVHGVAHTVRAFLPLLRSSGRGRMVILSGGGATKAMPNLAAYSATKTAVVRLGETLAAELEAERIPVNMLAPGAVNTTMLDELIAAGPARIGNQQYEAALKQRASGGSAPERGAALCAYMLSDEIDGITGKLISAIWDPWETLHEHRSDLAGTDLFTLRRVVQQERGLSW